MRSARKALAILVGIVLTLTGCASGSAGAPQSGGQPPLTELSPVADPRTLTGPATAVLANREIMPVASGVTSALPVTVTSHHRGGDRKVTINDTSRIVAFDLSGSIAATVWGLGLGDRLAARDISTNFPGTERLPVVSTDGHAINAEAVLGVRPSVVITDGSVGPRDVIEQLADTGIPVVFVHNVASYAGAQSLATDVAAILGVPEAGRLLAQRIGNDIVQAKTSIARLTPPANRRLRIVFLYVRAQSGVYYLLGDDSGAGELVKALGGIDVAAEQGWSAMRPLTDEAVVAAKPDLILMMTHGLESAGGVDGLLSSKPALALTPAGERRRFVDMADGDVLSFGPRSAQVLTALAAAVYRPGASR